MTRRLFALPAAFVVLFALVWSRPQDAEPQADARPERPASPQELADARNAYAALGGRYSKDGYQDRIYHRFSPPHPLTADTLAKLPDIPFDYTLELAVGPDTPPGTLKALAHLGNLRRVKVEYDRWSRFDPRRVSPARDVNITPLIAELAAVPNLESLDVYPISDRTLLTDELAALLPTFPSLRGVTGEGPITDEGLRHLARCPKLEAVSLQACENITDDGLAHLAAMPTLRNLVIQDCPRLTAVGIHYFTRKPRLVGLALGGRDMAEDVLAELERIPTLVWINFTTFRNEMSGDRALAHLAKLPRLRKLHLPRGTPYTDAGLRSLAAAPALEEVDLSGCMNVTDAGFAKLAHIKTLKFLWILGADQMTDAALDDLSRLPGLESLILSRAPRVTDRGMRAFIDRRGGNLRLLSLSSVPVTDAFVADLPKAAPNLHHLTLYQCKAVTDKSVGPISQLVHLRYLSLNHTAVTPGGVEALRRSLPGCGVNGQLALAK